MRASSRSEGECRDPKSERREPPENRAGGGGAPDDEKVGEPFSSPCSMELEIEEPSAPPERESSA